ncbi:hypothetical protein HCMG_00857 [Helicobacter canadensis MIT 98-5491]|uniref:Uncharacterized protein n=1 Tax=Helicobacter canadensis MIT 98-5491 TaxID=537970 RepID=C5ZXL5_9HELI|nr:hypothetical protein HCAN_1172 [Helicobacter canadensis MIT 98-5491]EFR48684.1 hypothetical protein HCMG_00857 [Helicobacter canadensis MIT 98-5491]
MESYPKAARTFLFKKQPLATPKLEILAKRDKNNF